ncbi:hypothetical protein Tco_1246586 [Tanacetum coccineum]
MNIDQDRQMLMVDDNVRNQFRENAMQNVRHLVGQNAVQNQGTQNVRNQNGLCVVLGIANQHGNRNVIAAQADVKPRKRDVAYLQTQLQIAQKDEGGIQLTQEEFDFMADASAYEENKRVNANFTLKDNLQQASISDTQTDKAPVYDSDELAEVHHLENCYDNDIFNMFTQEEKYNELLEPIPKSHQVPQNDSNVISEVSSVEQSGGTIEQHLATPEETCALYDSLYNNLATEVEKVNSINRKLRETNADLTTELARYKNQEKCFEISQEKYDKLERADESLANHKALELEIERLLRAVVSQDIISIVQNNSVVDTSNLQTEFERTKERFENYIIKKENEYAKLWNDWYKKCEECKYDKISYDKAYNDMQQNIEQLQAQLGDIKGKSKDTLCVSDTLDPLPQKHENENVELEFQVLNYEKENAHLKTTYKNVFDSINVTRAQTKTSNALSKLVTSNSAPSSRESTVVNNERVIAPGIFRINPFKASRVDNFVPNKHVKASIRTKPITVSQSHVITKNDVNSKTNVFFPNNVESTTRTRRPQPRNNPKSDKVPFKSKSSCLSNKLEKIKENHRSLQSSNYPDHTSSECNNIKLAIQNEKSEVICATCKQCLITANHDECVLQYVNGMKSIKKNQSANVSKSANQKKHKAQSWKAYSVICSTNYSNGENQVVSKSSDVTTADASDKRQQQQDLTSSTSTLTTTITADGNFDLYDLQSMNLFSTGQQHTEQPESNNEGEVDQNADQCYDTRPLPAKLTDNTTTELSNQLLESEMYSLKYRYIAQSYNGRTQSLAAKKIDISENRASRNFNLMIIKWCLLKITLQAPSNCGSSHPEGEHIKKDKGKKAMSLKDAEEDLKKFDFVTKDGDHVHLTKEQISAQKQIEEAAKAEAAGREGEMRKEELIDLLCDNRCLALDFSDVLCGVYVQYDIIF